MTDVKVAYPVLVERPMQYCATCETAQKDRETRGNACRIKRVSCEMHS